TGPGERKSCTIGGQRVPLYEAERVALYLASLNEDNMRHLTSERGGFVLTDDLRREPPYRPSEEDVLRVAADVAADPRLKKLADAIHHVFNVILPKYLNETSMRLNLFEIAGVHNYFPIRTSRVHRAFGALTREATPEDVSGLAATTFEGSGSLKLRQPGASNPVVLQDVFSALRMQTRVAALYHGYAPALRMAKAVLRGKMQGAKVGSSPAVETAIAKGYGDHYWRAIESIPRDVEQPSDLTPTDRLVSKGLGLLTKGALAYNVPVSVMQTFSYLTAMPYIPFKYWAANATAMPESYDVMGKHSAILWARGQGMISLAVGETLQGRVGKFAEVGLKPIHVGDHLAIGKIWKAVHQWFRAENPGMSESDLNDRVAKMVVKITQRTQPTFEKITRAYAARIRNPFVRGVMRFTSFTAKLYSMGFRANQSFRHGKISAPEWLRTMAIIYLLQNALVALLRSATTHLYRRWRKEDDNFWQTAGRNFLGGLMTPGGQAMNIVGGAILSGFEPSEPVGQMVERLWGVGEGIYKTGKLAVTGEKYRRPSKYGKVGTPKWRGELKKNWWRWARTVGGVTGGWHNIVEPARAAYLWYDQMQHPEKYKQPPGGGGRRAPRAPMPPPPPPPPPA
ncbi:MAG: hypothetical protein KJ556_21415, partial [Gammaproteobacteria bacterium]|nr:hypothetical protein [Gammaproteobacteria bacterium]